MLDRNMYAKPDDRKVGGQAFQQSFISETSQILHLTFTESDGSSESVMI